jgi:hypothetical protein
MESPEWKDRYKEVENDLFEDSYEAASIPLIANGAYTIPEALYFRTEPSYLAIATQIPHELGHAAAYWALTQDIPRLIIDKTTEGHNIMGMRPDPTIFAGLSDLEKLGLYAAGPVASLITSSLLICAAGKMSGKKRYIPAFLGDYMFFTNVNVSMLSIMEDGTVHRLNDIGEIIEYRTDYKVIADILSIVPNEIIELSFIALALASFAASTYYAFFRKPKVDPIEFKDDLDDVIAMFPEIDTNSRLERLVLNPAEKVISFLKDKVGVSDKEPVLMNKVEKGVSYLRKFKGYPKEAHVILSQLLKGIEETLYRGYQTVPGILLEQDGVYNIKDVDDGMVPVEKVDMDQLLFYEDIEDYIKDDQLRILDFAEEHAIQVMECVHWEGNVRHRNNWFYEYQAEGIKKKAGWKLWNLANCLDLRHKEAAMFLHFYSEGYDIPEIYDMLEPGMGIAINRGKIVENARSREREIKKAPEILI